MTIIETSRRPLVSVLVPARNEEANIEACLRSLAAQSFQDMEVVVVDGRSSDATLQVVRSIASEVAVDVLVAHNGRQTIPHALNIGRRVAGGALLVRVDAHATVRSDYVARVVAWLCSGEWAGVGGTKVAAGSSPWAEAFAVAFRSRLAGGALYHHGREASETDHVPFGAYPRFVVEALGGWSEEFVVNQDYEFDFRVRQAGGRLLFDPSLKIMWRARDTLNAIAYQYARYGAGKASVLRVHPTSIRARQLGPPVMLAGVAASFLLAVATGRTGVMAPYGTYVVAVSIGGIRAARRARLRGTVVARVPVVLLTMHHAWGAGFYREMLNLRRRNARDPFRENPKRIDGGTIRTKRPVGA